MAKPLIQPIFVVPSSLIAIAPFLYLWNNEPGFIGKNVWLAFFTPVIVFFVIALALSYLMTVCWSLWRSDSKIAAGNAELSKNVVLRKGISPLLLWGGVGALALVAVVAVLLFLHSRT